MLPDNVRSVLAIGENFEYSLFKTAISFAENGLHVWFISPQAFEKAPKDIKTPDKEILQLITFMYLKDYTDLVTQLNGIHLWRKTPNVIIVTQYEHYCNFDSINYSPIQAALITTSILDSAAVCAVKKKDTITIIVSCSEPITNDSSRLQVLRDLYFKECLHKTDDKFHEILIELLK